MMSTITVLHHLHCKNKIRKINEFYFKIIKKLIFQKGMNPHGRIEKENKSTFKKLIDLFIYWYEDYNLHRKLNRPKA